MFYWSPVLLTDALEQGLEVTVSKKMNISEINDFNINNRSLITAEIKTYQISVIMYNVNIS